MPNAHCRWLLGFTQCMWLYMLRQNKRQLIWGILSAGLAATNSSSPAMERNLGVQAYIEISSFKLGASFCAADHHAIIWGLLDTTFGKHAAKLMHPS